MKYVNTIEDLEKAGAEYFVIYDESMSYMGADYGPPDPPPSMETKKYLGFIAFTNQAELSDWVLKSQTEGRKQKIKIFKYDPKPFYIKTSIEF
jgi:hypothetical protein